MEILLTQEKTQAVDVFKAVYIQSETFIHEIEKNYTEKNIRKFTLHAKVSPEKKYPHFRNKYAQKLCNTLIDAMSYITTYDFEEIEICDFDQKNCYLHKNKGTVIVYITEGHARALRALNPHQVDLTIKYKKNCKSEYCYRVSFDIDHIIHIEKIH